MFSVLEANCRLLQHYNNIRVMIMMMMMMIEPDLLVVSHLSELEVLVRDLEQRVSRPL